MEKWVSEKCHCCNISNPEERDGKSLFRQNHDVYDYDGYDGYSDDYSGSDEEPQDPFECPLPTDIDPQGKV